MRILITGISGFIGTTLTEMLVKNHDVHGIDIAKPVEQISGGNYIYGNLLDREFLSNVFNDHQFDVIIHAAAQARVEPSLTDPIGTYRLNTEATINLLEQAKKYGTRFIYFSSETTYGGQSRYPCREDFALSPNSPYAASKASADLLTQQVDKRGISTVVARSAMGYGERSPPIQFITKAILRCLDDKPLLFPSEKVIHPTRDCNYVQNFAQGINKIVEYPAISGVYNLGSGREIDLLTLSEIIIDKVGKGSIKYDPEYHYREGEEGVRAWLDITKANKDFAYNPPYTLEEGIERTVAWLKANRARYGW